MLGFLCRRPSCLRCQAERQAAEQADEAALNARWLDDAIRRAESAESRLEELRRPLATARDLNGQLLRERDALREAVARRDAEIAELRSTLQDLRARVGLHLIDLCLPRAS